MTGKTISIEMDYYLLCEILNKIYSWIGFSYSNVHDRIYFFFNHYELYLRFLDKNVIYFTISSDFFYDGHDLYMKRYKCDSFEKFFKKFEFALKEASILSKDYKREE